MAFIVIADLHLCNDIFNYKTKLIHLSDSLSPNLVEFPLLSFFQFI